MEVPVYSLYLAKKQAAAFLQRLECSRPTGATGAQQIPGSMDSCNINMVDGNITSTSLTSLFRALEAQMTVDRVMADTQNRAAVPEILGFFQAGQMPATSFGNLASGPPFPGGLGIHSAKPNLNSIHGNSFLPYKSCLLSHTSIPHSTKLHEDRPTARQTSTSRASSIATAVGD